MILFTTEAQRHRGTENISCFIYSIRATVNVKMAVGAASAANNAKDAIGNNSLKPFAHFAFFAAKTI